jgi:hypothetical protein
MDGEWLDGTPERSRYEWGRLLSLQEQQQMWRQNYVQPEDIPPIFSVRGIDDELPSVEQVKRQLRIWAAEDLAGIERSQCLYTTGMEDMNEASLKYWLAAQREKARRQAIEVHRHAVRRFQIALACCFVSLCLFLGVLFGVVL